MIQAHVIRYVFATLLPITPSNSVGKPGGRRCVLACVATLATLIAMLHTHAARAAFTTATFGANGQSGSLNGQVLTFGSGGEVYELDAFFAIAGQDLNGFTAGTAAQLSTHSLPSAVNYTFSSLLNADKTQLTLTYRFANSTIAPIDNAWFAVFVDPQIDEPVNGYANEAGLAFGAIGAGAGDSDPDAWEIDEPGYVFGDIFSNLLSRSLDSSNATPEAQPDDVSLGLAFNLGSLPPLATAVIDVLLSDSGATLSGFSLQHLDTSPTSPDRLTISGQSHVVPEPATWIGMMLGCAVAAILFRKPSVRRS